MNFEDFEAEAHRMWEEIPSEYKAGIDGIVVKREVEAHPDHDDYYTLGMCFTEPYPSSYMGPDSTRSILALYYGSFRKLADRDPEFPWAEELWETITHELRHHLEFLAEDDALEGVDYALEESYKRGEGGPFDPWYYQSGLPLAEGVYRVEYDVYVEQSWRPDAFARHSHLEFDWDGRRWSIPRPDVLGDLHYVFLPDLDAGGGTVQLVLVRDLSLGERLKRLWSRQKPELIESEADPKVVGTAPGSPGPEDGRPGRAAGGPPPAEDDRSERGQSGGGHDGKASK